MKKIVKLIVGLLLILALGTCFVCANELSADYTYTGKKLIVSGSYANENDFVSIYVLHATDNAQDEAVIPVIMEMTESDSMGNFSISIQLPETLPSGSYKINVASGTKYWESTVFEHINLSKLNIEFQDDSVSVTFPYQDDDLFMVVGIYNNEGILVGIDTDDSEDDSFKMSVSASDGAIYRVFLWNRTTMRPYCTELSGNIIFAT